MGWIPYPTALNGNVGTPQASAPQQTMGGAQVQMPHPQLLGQLLRGGGQGMPQPMPQPFAGQGADPFAAARAAVAQHAGQAMLQGGGMGAGQGGQFGALDPSTLSSSAQSGLDNLRQMVGRKSDRRLKSDVRRVGALPNGLPVYSYRLEGSPLFEIGVMADEAMVFDPGAVWEAEDGFLRVDYARLVG